MAEPTVDMPCPTGHVAHVAHASLPAAALNMPAGHAEHTRLDVSIGAMISYSPAAHVVMSRHTRSVVVVAAVKMYWSASHVVCELQPRSLLAVGAPCSYSVPVHVVTATQAAPLSTSEYVLPDWQAAHWRSAAAEPAAVRPWPAAHVAHVAQLSTASVVLVPALKVPSAQLAHCRSLLAVAAAVVWKPAAHGALTSAHAAPSLLAENVAPAVQAAHWRSAVAEPAADMPWLAPHVAHAAQLSLTVVLALALALKEPNAQASHSRSLLEVAPCLVNVPAEHLALTETHAAPLSVVEKEAPASQVSHWRLAVADPADDWPCPAGHVAHATQTSTASVLSLIVALNAPGAHASQV